MNETILDMMATAEAHEKWAASLEATAAESSASVAFAKQIREWVKALRG